EASTDDPERVAFALELLGDVIDPVARAILRERLGHESPRVRAAAIVGLARHPEAGDVERIAAALAGERDDDVERVGLAALAQLEQGPIRDEVRSRADDNDAGVRALARASLARAEGAGHGSLRWMAARAARRLADDLAPDSRIGGFHALLVSTDPEER